MTLSNRDVLEELRILLLVKEVHLSLEERIAKSIDGLPLRIEEERRTEAFIFTLAYAMFYGDVEGKLPPWQKMMPVADQRAFELEEFKDSMRLTRTGAGRLPSYVLEAHNRLVLTKKPMFLCVA